ncbi:hypothetical protein [Clostridium baratii]|uniref:Uncharacterized protein n=1 Tax=Clostridium baratii TaxID=1561 RepID=A0A174QIH7_9CLOT|nr:hypothetical protein [Clostridium baratii]CUP73062.1 Uncharacterised protein [Clostridium baratii]
MEYTEKNLHQNKNVEIRKEQFNLASCDNTEFLNYLAQTPTTNSDSNSSSNEQKNSK